MGYEDYVCEDTLSSQSTYKINSGCPYYKASIAPNPNVSVLCNQILDSMALLGGFSVQYYVSSSVRT